jgi:hypothetical protein
MILIIFFADNEIEMKFHGAFAFDMLSQFMNRYKGVYSEKSFYLDMPVKK